MAHSDHGCADVAVARAKEEAESVWLGSLDRHCGAQKYHVAPLSVVRAGGFSGAKRLVVAPNPDPAATASPRGFSQIGATITNGEL